MLPVRIVVACVTILAFGASIGQVQDATIVLSQGTLVGLKVFPETSRMPIYAYLGIPYAKPPIHEFRFAPPVPGPGWNRTLYARDFKPICPQIENSSYEDLGSENKFRSRETSEDCLYLNIWIPETAVQYGGFPVLVMITGEEMAFDWNANRASGLDLASDGVIVVTVQYRNNVFGWLSLGRKYAPGNLGLLDQQMALVWVKDNIQKFGGDTNRVTLLGHGTSGGPNVMTHMVSPRARGLFTRAIIMSGTVFSPYSAVNLDNQLSLEIVKILACNYEVGRNVLKCLQQKSVHDLLRAYEYIYRNGNYTMNLGAIVDNYLPSDERYVPDDPQALFEAKAFISEDMPIMIGITSNEGAFLFSKWVELARQSYRSLKKYVNDTLLPNIIEQYKFEGVGQDQIRETINWRFFDQIPQTTAHLLHAVIKIVSETHYEIPFYKTLHALSRQPESKEIAKMKVDDENAAQGTTKKKHTNTSTLYAYLFHHPNSMDMRGRINLFGGASHSSDLPFVMGPSLYREIGRRRLSQVEDKLCKKIRSFSTEFIKGGDPTPGRQFDSWVPYTNELKYIKLISAKPESVHRGDHASLENTFEDNLHEIEGKLLTREGSADMQTNNSNSAQNPYNLNPNEQTDQENSRSPKNTVLLANTRNSEYFYYLRRINSFWEEFLPKLSKIVNETNQEKLRNRRIDLTLEEEQDLFRETAAASKYKHAFFSMLTLLFFRSKLFDRKSRRKKPDVSSMGDEDEFQVTGISHRMKTAERVIRTNPLYEDNFRKYSESLSKSTVYGSGVSASNKNVVGTPRSSCTAYEQPIAVLTDLDEDQKTRNWRYQLSASHFQANRNPGRRMPQS